MKDNEIQVTVEEDQTDIDTYDCAEDVKALQMQLQMERTYRLVLGSMLGVLSFVFVCMLLSNNIAGARLTILFSLMLASCWVVHEIMLRRSRQTH